MSIFPFFVIFQHFNTKIWRSHYMYFLKDALSNTTALFYGDQCPNIAGTARIEC
jgi:hypothetical protein